LGLGGKKEPPAFDVTASGERRAKLRRQVDQTAARETRVLSSPSASEGEKIGQTRRKKAKKDGALEAGTEPSC